MYLPRMVRPIVAKKAAMPTSQLAATPDRRDRVREVRHRGGASGHEPNEVCLLRASTRTARSDPKPEIRHPRAGLQSWRVTRPMWLVRDRPRSDSRATRRSCDRPRTSIETIIRRLQPDDNALSHGAGGCHVDLYESVHLHRIFHREFLDDRFDEPGYNH